HTHSPFPHKFATYPTFTQEDPPTYLHQEHTLLLLQIHSHHQVDLISPHSAIPNFFIKPQHLKPKNFHNLVYNSHSSSFSN
ncbi:DUF1963 domain-containing protein, partial [Bacillus pumilus]|uniref:DUF1963 domain-containing protein n=1 Tax=Bacillus pumilus TaxID=1408 RepID=UPI0011A2A324